MRVLDALNKYMDRQGVQASDGCMVVRTWLEHTKFEP